MSSEEEFLSTFQPALDALNDHIVSGNIVRIITHSDADGIAAGGILSRMVSRLGAGFKTTCEKRVDIRVLQEIAAEKPSLVIFSDLGSGYLDIIGEHLLDSDVIILDHHHPIEADAMRLRLGFS